jgi:hypothetical protein
MKNNRQNKYQIEIFFEKGNILKNKTIQSSYKGSRHFKDEIKINPTNITIIAKRSSTIKLNDIFYNHTSSMYIQIIKSIIFYYLVSTNFVKIKSIKIYRYRGKSKEPKDFLEFKNDEFTQIVSSDFTVVKNIKDDKLIKIFDNDEKGESLLIASSYLVKSLSLDDEIEKFEKLWKAFNRIYKYFGDNKNEFECQVKLRKFILENPTNFPLSTNIVDMLRAKEIREKLRWRALILNDYNTEKKTIAFSDFIKRYSDKRIMELFNQLLPYREVFLKNINLYNSVIKHIKENLLLNNNKNEELVVLLCIKYMYFVRNKLMHGEKLESSFRFIENKDVEEIKWLNKILKLLVIDLINCNNDL